VFVCVRACVTVCVCDPASLCVCDPASLCVCPWLCSTEAKLAKEQKEAAREAERAAEVRQGPAAHSTCMALQAAGISGAHMCLCAHMCEHMHWNKAGGEGVCVSMCV